MDCLNVTHIVVEKRHVTRISSTAVEPSGIVLIPERVLFRDPKVIFHASQPPNDIASGTINFVDGARTTNRDNVVPFIIFLQRVDVTIVVRCMQQHPSARHPWQCETDTGDDKCIRVSSVPSPSSGSNQVSAMLSRLDRRLSLLYSPIFSPDDRRGWCVPYAGFNA